MGLKYKIIQLERSLGGCAILFCIVFKLNSCNFFSPIHVPFSLLPLLLQLAETVLLVIFV